jgi:hypothetical protein
MRDTRSVPLTDSVPGDGRACLKALTTDSRSGGLYVDAIHLANDGLPCVKSTIQQSELSRVRAIQPRISCGNPALQKIFFHYTLGAEANDST